mgnify:CR=1 FL=1
MKKFLILCMLFFGVTVLYADDSIVTTRLIIADDPKSGVIHTLCIHGYVFAIYRNQRTVTTSTRGYAGESQSSSMVQIINDRGNGIKCTDK